MSVGHQQVQHRRGDLLRGCFGLGDICGAVQRQQPHGGPIARGEIGHCQRQHRAGVGRQIADDRAMAGFAHFHDHIGLPAHRDHLGAGDEAARAGFGLVAVTFRGFDEQILNIRPVGGEGPGNVAVVAEHHDGQAGGCGANQQMAGGFDPRQIPDRRLAESKMRIAGQQGCAGGTVRAIHSPFVAGGGGQGEGCGETRHHRRQPACHPRRQSRFGQGRGLSGPKCVDLCGCEVPGQCESRQFGVPVAGQVQPHRFAPHKAI